MGVVAMLSEPLERSSGIQSSHDPGREKGGEGGVGPLGVGEGLSGLRVWLACRHVDVSACLQLACWRVNTVVCWCGSMLVCRHIGTLVRWRFGALVCRHIAVLACQCWIGAMAHW